MDELLMAELKKFNLEVLYDKFCKAKITSDIIWILDEEMLEDIDLTKIEQFKYNQALETLKHTSWLMGELKRYNLEHLYDKFHQAAWITIDNIWTLNGDMLKHIGLTKIEQLKYKNALEKFNKHNIMRMDEMLMTELKKFNLEQLYDKFNEAKITTDIIWILDDEMLEDIGLTKFEKLKYRKALEKIQPAPWLMGELKRYNLEFLYDKFHEAGGMSIDNIWTLDDDLLRVIGLTKIEQLQYKKALKTFKQHGLNDNMLQKDALTKIELLKLLNSTAKVSQRISI